MGVLSSRSPPPFTWQLCFSSLYPCLVLEAPPSDTLDPALLAKCIRPTSRHELVRQLNGHVKVGHVEVSPRAVVERGDASLGQRGVMGPAHRGRQTNHRLACAAEVPHFHRDVRRDVTHVTASIVTEVQLLAEPIQVLQDSVKMVDAIMCQF